MYIPLQNKSLHIQSVHGNLLFMVEMPMRVQWYHQYQNQIQPFANQF